MYINLPFKLFGIRFERPIDIVLNLGTLEDICNDVSIEFHEIGQYIKDNGATFSVLLLYYGYLSGCKARRAKPRYTKKHAERWSKYITAIEQAKLYILIGELYGKLKSTNISPESKKKV